nr:hypothetical protein [Cyanobacteria bacterium RUI128]
MKRIAEIVLFTGIMLTGMMSCVDAADYMYNVPDGGVATFIGDYTYTKEVYPTYKNAGVRVGDGAQIFVGSEDEQTITIFANNKDNNATVGGALYNPQGYINSVINTIFKENHVTKYGGAIYNNKTIAAGSISGSSFIKNSAKVSGGAIYSAGSMPTITDCVFDQNEARGETKGEVGYGGAIYAKSDLTITNSNFTNNHAYTKGGAIAMNKGNLTIIASDGNTSNFSGNIQASGRSNSNPNDIYMGGSGQILKLYAMGANSVINFEGGIDFANNLTVHINQPNAEHGKIVLGGAVGSSSLRPTMYIYGGEISLISNDVFNNVYAGKVYLQGDTKLGFDVDLSANTYKNDCLNVTSVTGNNKFVITADSFNIISGFTSDNESAVLDFVVSGTSLARYVELQDDNGEKVSIVYQYYTQDEGDPSIAKFKIRQLSGGKFIISDPYYIDIVSNPLAYAVNYNGEPKETTNTDLATLNLYGNSCVLTLKKNLTIDSWEDVPVENDQGEKVLTPRNVQVPGYLLIEGKNKTITSIDGLVGMVTPEGKDTQINNTIFYSFDRAVKDDGGTINLNNVGFQNNFNKDDGNGSAIVNLAGTMNLMGAAKKNKSLFYNNNAENGGAIYNAGKMTITYNTFGAATTKKAVYNNIATNGGAIYNVQSDTFDDVTDEFTPNLVINTSNFVENIAKKGGAIYNVYGDNGALYAARVNGTFYKNMAIDDGYGGAIYNEGHLEAYKSTFGRNKKSAQANTAAYGGAVANIGEGILRSDASSYYLNSATEKGGAVYNTGTANINGGNFTSNSAVAGGAIYNAAEGTLHLDQFTEMVLKKNTYTPQITSLYFKGNTSSEKGGAIYNEGVIGFSRYDYNNYPANMMGEFTNNKAVVPNQSKKGVNEGDVDNVNLYTAPVGGAIYNSGTLNLANAKFTSNSVSSKVELVTRMYNPPNSLMAYDTITKFVGHGGAIYSDSAEDMIILKSTFSKNKAAQSGGAIHNNNEDSVIHIVDSDFTSNSSKTIETTINYSTVQNGSKTKTKKTTTKENIGAGGAIYTAGAVEINTNDEYKDYLVDMTNFKSNSSAAGGAIYAGKTVNGEYATFTSNSATDKGGAVYTTDNVNFTYSVFTKNSAGSNGGAIHGKDVDIIDSSFTSNSSKGNGGAIYATGNVKINALDYTSEVLYDGSNFTSNSAVNGGAVYSSGTTLIKNSTFRSNKATENGGAVFTSSDMHLIDTSFTGNSGKDGGAVYAAPYSVTYLVAYDKDINITNNKASHYGGAIYVDYKAEFNIIAYRKNITISGNKMRGKFVFNGKTYSSSNAIYLFNSNLNIDTYTDQAEGYVTTVKITDNIYGEGNAYLRKYGNGKLEITGQVVGLNVSDEADDPGAHLLEGASGSAILDDIIYGSEIVVSDEGNLYGSSMGMGSSLLNIANGKIGKLALKDLTVKNDVSNVAIDMDLKNGTSDKITAETKEGGEINVSKVNLISDSKTPVVIKVGEDSEVTSVSATTAETKEATYKLKSRLGAGGQLEAVAFGQKAKPCALAAPVAAQLGGYLTQINSYDQAFMNMDMNMLKTREERLSE